MFALRGRNSRQVVLHFFLPVLARFEQDPVRYKSTLDLRSRAEMEHRRMGGARGAEASSRWQQTPPHGTKDVQRWHAAFCNVSR
jgi:hypothetical protein